jgi:hypothetical protein
MLFVVAFQPKPPGWGAPGGGVSIRPPMTLEFQHCSFDEAGTCTIRGVRPGEYEGSVSVHYGTASVGRTFGTIRVPWNRTQMRVDLSSPW